jgi:hypothetical protein
MHEGKLARLISFAYPFIILQRLDSSTVAHACVGISVLYEFNIIFYRLLQMG